MCIVAWCQHLHSSFPFILIANRDEFLNRETTPLSNTVFERTFAGKDVRGGGTWLAINELGYFGALTNLRVPFDQLKTENTKSRGAIITDYLQNSLQTSWTSQNLKSFLMGLHQEREFYNDYNIVCGNITSPPTIYYGSHNQVQRNEDAVMHLQPGKVYSVSNASLHDMTPWPKTDKLQGYLKSAVDTFDNRSLTLDSSSLHSFSYKYQNQRLTDNSASSSSQAFLEHLFDALNDANRLPHDDPQLPITGIGLEWDQWLSSIFIEQGPKDTPYGTRSQCAILMDFKNVVTVIERTRKLPSLVLTESHTEARSGKNWGFKEVEDDRGAWIQTWYQFSVDQQNINQS